MKKQNTELLKTVAIHTVNFSLLIHHQLFLKAPVATQNIWLECIMLLPRQCEATYFSVSQPEGQP